MGAYGNNRPNRNYMVCMVAKGPTRSMGHTLDPHQTQGLTIKHLACLVSDTIKRRKVEMSDIYIEVEYYYLRTNRGSQLCDYVLTVQLSPSVELQVQHQ